MSNNQKLKGIPLLLEMLTYARPAGSRSERRFIRRFIVPTGAKSDSYGNRILRIGSAPIVWCSHTDTVHRFGGRQDVRVIRDVVSAPFSNCLGADDTTGVWLMLEMIRHGVEGLYIFHRGEEVGCVGSRAIADNTPEVLDGIDYAISFDRRGTDSIVTHQMGQRTCSDVFARSLAEALGTDDHMWADPSGVYTDTNEYAHLVPECTNISVGYMNQHSRHETQDLWFADYLLGNLLSADYTKLIAARIPKNSWLWEDAEDEYDGYDDIEWYEDECDFCLSPAEETHEFLGGRVCTKCLMAQA